MRFFLDHEPKLNKLGLSVCLDYRTLLSGKNEAIKTGNWVSHVKLVTACTRKSGLILKANDNDNFPIAKVAGAGLLLS